MYTLNVHTDVYKIYTLNVYAIYATYTFNIYVDIYAIYMLNIHTDFYTMYMLDVHTGKAISMHPEFSLHSKFLSYCLYCVCVNLTLGNCYTIIH